MKRHSSRGLMQRRLRLDLAGALAVAVVACAPSAAKTVGALDSERDPTHAQLSKGAERRSAEVRASRVRMMVSHMFSRSALRIQAT